MIPDYSQLFRHIPTGILLTDHDLCVKFINEFAKTNIFGFGKEEELKNLHDLNFYTTEMVSFEMDSCMKSLLEKEKRVFQKTLIYKTGIIEKLIFLSVNPIPAHGHDNHLVFTITDITSEMDCISQSRSEFSPDMAAIRKNIIGNDPRLKEIFRIITLAADTQVNVMIQGESGTGKELIADAIHQLSARKNKPFIKVNCAAYPESLLESELFGYKKGAFTGAYKDKPGKFELAHQGTIFLDEIGEISHSIQVKLLRVIQEKTIERLGDTVSKKVDMRIVAATNKDLRILVQNNLFREDLYYRLNVFSVEMPSLRQRPLDIPLLVDYFIDKFNSSTGKNIKALDKLALRKLMEYHWPGNIRQLQNAIEHAFVLAEGAFIQTEDLPKEVIKNSSIDKKLSLSDTLRSDDKTIIHSKIQHARRGNRLNLSKEELIEILEAHDYNQSKAAEFMGISRVALWKKMKKLGV